MGKKSMRRDVHKRDSKTIIALVCLCLFFLTSVITQYDNLVENHPYSYSQHSSKKHSLRYTPHEWINITSDADFSKYNFTGSGLKSDPYQIANLEIICNESYGIRLINTTK
ncbi:MAG: hypothetical protein U9O98_05575, partial [Asgard group archaeon]|nr:hypothetical protein [Asgard group archaeon]